MTLAERAQQLHYLAVQDRLRNPPNAVDDSEIDLKPKPKVRPPIWTLKMGPVTPYLVPRTVPAPEDVTRIVCEHFKVSPDDLQSSVRTQVFVRPRQAWAYLAKEVLGLSYPQIGRYLGGRDHTTQIHAHNRVSAMVENDTDFATEIDLLKFRLGCVFSMRSSVRCFDPREF